MTRPTDETLLAFLEGSLNDAERSDLLDQLDADPALAADLRRAAAGLAAVGTLEEAPAEPAGSPAFAADGRPRAESDTALSSRAAGRGISPWWVVAASIATLLVSVPATMRFAAATEDRVPGQASSGPTGEGAPTAASGRPTAPAPSFVLVLHGLWPDAAAVDGAETSRRADEYWRWTSSLADAGLLVAAGDLRWEPGERLAPAGVEMSVPGQVVDGPDFVVGMFAVRAGSYEAAMAIAKACPHLKYGGSVSVRQVGQGFVTVPGQGDWQG